MKQVAWLIILLQMPFSVEAVLFQGITEVGVSKNTFLCSGAAAGMADCTAADQGAQGYDLSGGKTLQLFNNQAAWLLSEATQKQYVQQVLRRTGSALQGKMESDGWVAMGGYCLVITTNAMVTDVVMPDMLKPAADSVKVVVQLWYNGDKIIQLWSQDVTYIDKNQTFTVAVSTNADPLTGLNAATAPSTSMRLSFLSALGWQVQNRKESIYSKATQSPRSVKIIAS